MSASLWSRVEERAGATPEAPLAVDERERRLSFAGYREAALRTAAALFERGIGAEDRVSWMLPTTLEAMVLVGALARLGAVQNPILPMYRERETRFIMEQVRPRLLIVPGVWRGFDYAAMAQQIVAGHPGIELLVLEDALPEAEPSRLPAAPAPGEADPVRWIFYSSGTTAEPKGALHTDASLGSAASALEHALELEARDRVAFVFPFTHVGGIVWLFAGLAAGCTHVLVESFDPKRSVDVLARHGVTLGTAGTVFHQAYLAAQRERGAEPLLPDVRAFPGGGAPKPPDLHLALKRELGGVGIVSGYGLTECPIATMSSVRDLDGKLAHTEGRPTSGMEVRIDPGKGEILLRGPQLCRGYLDARRTRESFSADGWFRTGDLGRLDPDGHLVVTGRLKDVIIRKGENISAKEIEDLLHRHPKVAEAAVVGLPDPERGERVCAVVACRPGEPLGFEEMQAFLKQQRLAVQKLPEQLECLPHLPRNATGKVLKQELRGQLS